MDKQIHWPSLLRELDATETAWNSRPVRYPREDAVPWMPIAIPTFVTLLTEAVMVAAPCMDTKSMYSDHFAVPRFLDVGCGPGTKVRLAEALFGLQGMGIDIVPRFIAECEAHGVRSQLADAFGFEGYDGFQIVLVNRPSSLQDELEHLIMEKMASDAVLIAVNWKHDPSREGWIIQHQEYEPRGPVMGVFIKP